MEIEKSPKNLEKVFFIFQVSMIFPEAGNPELAAANYLAGQTNILRRSISVHLV